MGPWPVRRRAARTVAGVACLLLVATPSVAGSTPQPNEPAGEASPRPAVAASEFAAIAAERPLRFSPALEARLSAGTPVAVEKVRPEVPRPEAPPEPVADLAALHGDLKGAAERHAGRYGVVVFDPDSKGGVSLGGDEAFTAASVGKLPTLLALYRAAARGELDLDQKISILPEDYRSYGTGVLHDRAAGTEMTLRECAYYLIKESDNTAWKMFTRYLGSENIQAELYRIGADSTSYWDPNTTTPSDVTLMLKKIADPDYTSPDLSAEMLDLMTNTEFEARLPAPLPDGTRVAHKIGSYGGTFSDAGVVFPEGSNNIGDAYFIVVIASGVSEATARKAIQEMSLITYRSVISPDLPSDQPVED